RVVDPIPSWQAIEARILNRSDYVNEQAGLVRDLERRIGDGSRRRRHGGRVRVGIGGDEKGDPGHDRRADQDEPAPPRHETSEWKRKLHAAEASRAIWRREPSLLRRSERPGALRE